MHPDKPDTELALTIDEVEYILNTGELTQDFVLKLERLAALATSRNSSVTCLLTVSEPEVPDAQRS